MLPGQDFLFAALLAGVLAAAVIGLVREVRGVTVDPARPASGMSKAVAALRSPAVAGRVGGSVLVGALTLVVTRWPVGAVGVIAVVLWWPKLFGGNRFEQAQIVRLEALVVWTESLRDTIAAHASLEQAIPVTAHNAPQVLRPALVRLIGQIRARVPMDKALLSLAAELDDPSADLVIAALILNVRRRGDRLGEVLSGLAAAAREELEMRRRVSAGRAELRRGVQIVVGVTLSLAVALVLFSPGYVAPYDTAGGQIVLAAVFLIFTTGFAWMRRLSGQGPVAPFLARPGQDLDPAEAHLVATLTAGESA